MPHHYSIKEIPIQDLQQALKLVWYVFLEFEAEEYDASGVDEFKRYIDYESVKNKLLQKELHMWACYDDEKIVGVMATRTPHHISLLFVDKQYHKQGIARSLLNAVIEYYKKKDNSFELTVNSSPYATAIYHRLGFSDTDTEQTINGIRFIPMKRKIHS